jgi:hypothetical protein
MIEFSRIVGTVVLAVSIMTITGLAQAKESFSLDWPDSENWKVGSSQENEQMVIVELVRGKETVEKWTELGTMTSYKGVKGKNVENMRDQFYSLNLKSCKEAKLTTLNKDLDSKYPSVIFSIECPAYNDGTGPESQVWLVVQGHDGLYTNQRALKVSKIPENIRSKFVNFFKTGKVISN